MDEFSHILEPTFNPITHANELILSTNGTNNTELDILTPIKKLQFDNAEADKRMSQITSENYDVLITNFTKIEQHKTLLSNTINVSVERINTSYNRLQKNVVKPYNEALELNGALRKIHTTLDLLRTSSHMIYLIQQVEELSKQDDESTMIRLSKLYLQLSELYVTQKSPIKLIKGYFPLLVNKKLELQTQTVQHILNTPLTTTVQPYLLSLYYVHKDEFFATIEKAFLTKHVTNSANQLSRLLQSPRNFTLVMSEIFEFSKDHFENVDEVLKVELDDGILLDLILEDLDVKNLSDLYWERLLGRFKKNIAATMARGGPIAKNLRIYSEGIRQNVGEIFGDHKGGELILDAVGIIL